MRLSKNKKSFLVISLIISLFTISFGQKATDGSVSQRLSVMDNKLEQMKSSLKGAISGLKQEGAKDKKKKDEKENLDTPLSRLKSLEKEVSRLNSEVNNVRGKVDRAEKYEASDIDQLETAVSEINDKVDKALTETAKDRANPVSNVGSAREIKKKTRKFLGLIPIGKERDEYEDLIGSVVPGRDRELFIVATREVRKSNHEVGRLLFNVIITTYPDSPYLPMSKLAIADSFFLEGTSSNLIQAAASYQDWLAFFPTHPLADRVLLKIAESEMRQIGLPDRDATRAKRAEQRLKALLQQYPNSLLRKEAENRLQEVQDNLGLHSLWIANFYYKKSIDQKKGGLKGSQSRYREILDKYPNFTYMDEALFKLAITYQAEEETDEAVKYFQKLVRDYPNSEYLEKAKEQLQLMGATIPETNPERNSVLAPEKESFFQNFKNELFGIYPMTIDKNGVLMTKDFDKSKFELIDKVIENQGELTVNQIPKALTTVVGDRPAINNQQ